METNPCPQPKWHQARRWQSPVPKFKIQEPRNTEWSRGGKWPMCSNVINLSGFFVQIVIMVGCEDTVASVTPSEWLARDDNH